MLLKKLESFFLLLTFGLFLFSCTVEEKKEVEKPRESTECKVSIEILGANSLEICRFEFSGTYGGSPIYIPETTGFGNQELVLGASGDLLEIAVRAYSVKSGELIAEGSASKEILKGIEGTNFEIKLTPSFVGDFIYLTLNDDGNTSRLAYKKNELVGDYTEPKKDSYSFAGWFSEPNGKGEKLNSNYTMSSDITFYAYWIASNDNTEYTVVFETRGGSSVSPETVPVNSTIDKPEDPTKPDYSFTGWFTDAGKLVSFPYTVIGDTTLYAGWVSSGSIVNVTGVTLGKSALEIEINKTTTLNHFITPPNATNKGVSWSSSNPSVVTVNNGEIRALAAGSATITVTTADGGCTATCSVTVTSVNPTKTLSVLILTKSAASTEEIPAFTATAKYSDRKTEDVTSKADWESTNTSIATISGGIATLVAAGSTEVTASYTVDGVTKESNKATVTVSAKGGNIDKLFFMPSKTWSEASPRYAAYFFKDAVNVWVSMTESSSGVYVCDKQDGYSSVIFCRMNPGTTDNSWGNKWNQTGDLTIPDDKDTYKYADGAWEKGSGEWLSDLTGTYGGGSLTATVDVETPTIPEKPTVNMNPSASGEISLKGNIVVDYVENNASVTAASVTISGAVSKTYSLTDFSGKKISISVERLGLTAGATITVIAEATNSEGTTSVGPLTFTVKDVPPPPPPSTDTFTWDNANVYFVIQDRFYDGDSSNNNSYGRMSTDDLGKKIGTFHGGDIKGLTQKLDYLDGLGINAIWVTALYEQAHGWCGGGSNGDFAHYAYHGYYPLDYTMMDKNMGTVEEFRTFVTECHKRGIRVVMDVVMNHTGYLTLQDCQDYGIDIFKGSYSGGKSIDKGFKIGSDGSTYHDHHNQIDYDGHNDGWAKWWGASWIRAGVPGYTAGGGGDLTMNLDNLPDVKTESSNAQTVAPILQTKWAKETSGYDDWIIPAAKSLRSTSATNAPVVWIEKWLAAWVEEFGIDGFRCDTAKHIDYYRWKELKEMCKTALKTWRSSSRADQYAKDWDEEFWMTGEAFGWKKGGDNVWFNNGFDSMIDFTVAGGPGMGSYSPSLPSWDNRMGDSQALLYISSHDTGLGRSSNQLELGTSFVLMPGLVQIYYGDETGRAFGETGSDPNQGTRSDFDWGAASGDCAKHWGKVGTFRKYNPAVGAGTGSGTKRTYNDSKVAIGISGTSVDVSGLFNDGETVYNWYDGKSAVVSSGKVTFQGGSMKQPILVSDRNPADYDVTF